MSNKKNKGGKQPEDFKFDFNAKQSGEGKKEGQSAFDFNGKDATLVAQFQKHLEKSLAGKSSGYFESLPKQVQERVKALKFLHSQRLKLEKDFNKELQELEKKYESLYQPLIDRRQDIVSGSAEPKPEELVEEKKEEAKAAEPKKEVESKKEEEQNIKGVPEFWLTALKHHEDFGAMITDADEGALKHLTDIRVGPAPEHSSDSFKIDFHFSDNEFFDNKVISKTYILKENPADGEVMYDHVDSTTINWKPNKNLTVKKVTKQQKKKGGKAGRGGKRNKGGPAQTITVEEPTESFFYFFNPESAYALYGGGMDDQEEEEFDDGGLGEFLELDYELGLELREKLIPHAVIFYTGENIMMDDMDEEEEEQEDDGEEHGEEDEDEEEDAEYEPPQTTGQGQQQNPECKQQ